MKRDYGVDNPLKKLSDALHTPRKGVPNAPLATTYHGPEAKPFYTFKITL